MIQLILILGLVIAPAWGLNWKVAVISSQMQRVEIKLKKGPMHFEIPNTQWKCQLGGEEKIKQKKSVIYKRKIECTNPASHEKVSVPLICLGEDTQSTDLELTDKKRNVYQLKISCSKN